MTESLILFLIFLAIYSPAIVLAVFVLEAKQKRREKAARKERTVRRQQLYADRTQAQRIHDLIHKE